MHYQQNILFFYSPWNFVINKKYHKTQRQKLGFLCISSSKINKQFPEENLNHFESLLISLLFKILGIPPQQNLFCMSEWSSFLSDFGAKMRVTIEKKANSNIPEVRKKLTCWLCLAWLTIQINFMYKNSLTCRAFSLNHLKKKRWIK